MTLEGYNWKTGDVFTLPVADEKIGLGQIVAVFSSELFVVVFEPVWPASQPPRVESVNNMMPAFASLTLDAKLHHGHWIIIGNTTANLSTIRRPVFKVKIRGVTHVESLDESWAREATPVEAEQLGFRKTVAPIRLQKALQALHGLAPTEPRYEELRYNRIQSIAGPNEA